MSEPHDRRARRLARELALYRYSRAFERGDIETIEIILQEASQDAELERMIYAMHELDQSSGQSFAPVTSSNHAIPAPTEQAPESTLSSQPGGPKRGRGARTRFQMLAAVLVVAVLIIASVLLFTSLHAAPGTGSHATTPTSTVTAQGMVIALLANGDVQAYRGVTGQSVWSYSTGRQAPNTPEYNNALIVQNQVVYVAMNKSIYALHENTGKLIWQKTLPVQPESNPAGQMLVDAGIVYVSVEQEPQSVAYALRADDGQILWHVSSTDVYPPLMTASGGIAYVAIQNASMTPTTTIEALRGSDEHEIWHYTSPGAVSFATVANNTLYVYAFPGAIPPGTTKLDKQLLALNLNNGAVIWSHNVSYGNYNNNIAYAQGVLIIQNGDELCAHSSANGSLLWCKQPPTFGPASNTSATLAGFLVGSDKLYVAYALQKAVPPSPTQIAGLCKGNQTCIYREATATPGAYADIEQLSIQVEALNLQNGQPQWTSSSIPATNEFIQSVSLDVVQLQKDTLLVSGGSPLVVALDISSGHVLWQIAGSAQQTTVLQVVGTD